jgi:hypothetical protein
MIDSTVLSEAEDYGDFKIHAGDHYSVWEKLQQAATVPADMEYEEAPRGRVVYNAKRDQFTLLADSCILKDKNLVGAITAELNLPSNRRTGADDHYRCLGCLRKSDP